MQSGWLLIAIVLVGLYVMVPWDFLYDRLPFVGWLDDTFLVGLLLYYFRYRKLPRFLIWLGRRLFRREGGQRDAASGAGRERAGGRGAGKKAASGRVKDPHAVLGVSRGAGRAEIQAAYREAVQKYHPDKVAHLGDEFKELAEQKFIEIQEAYDQLMGKG
jgi:hypothetical protein